MKTIVFSDVDGTLLTDDKRVRPATRAAVRTLAKRGIPFVIVSARRHSNRHARFGRLQSRDRVQWRDLV